MKFFIINNLFEPYARGGTETVVKLISRSLAAYGQVVLITSHPHRDEFEEKDGLKIYRFNPKNFYYLLDDYRQPYFKKFFWHLKDLGAFGLRRKLKKLIKAERPDVILTHNLKGLGLGLFKTVSRSKILHCHTLHDYQLLEPHGSMFRNGHGSGLKGFGYQFYRLITRSLIGSPETVIAPSKFVLDKHLKYGFFKDSVKKLALPNPVGGSFPQISRQKSDYLRVVYLGQVEEHKGVEFLTAAFKKFNDRRFKLDVYGDGSRLAEVKRLAAGDSRIRIHGHIDHKDLSELFGKTDILVVPSLWWENSPTVIYEAYLHKVPVIVSAAGGSKELVINGQTGWVFKTGDAADLAEKLKLALREKITLPQMGRNGFNLIDDFIDSKYCAKLVDLCRK
jgi:glycosyltransferase involved in cell wall biosynthesis